MLDLESRGPGSIPTRGGVIFCFKFCNPNLHNIARSDRMRFKTKNPSASYNQVHWLVRTPYLSIKASNVLVMVN